jgi:hypothetical protein
MFRITCDACTASSSTIHKGHRSTLSHPEGFRCMRLSFRRQTTREDGAASGMQGLPGIRAAAQAEKQSHILVSSLLPSFVLMWSEDLAYTAKERRGFLQL